MPRATAVLDSSPAQLPKQKKQPFKRTHSAASIASLPTPPRTRKRKRSHSGQSRATDSESELDQHDSDFESDAPRKDGKHVDVATGHKRRKMLRVDAIAAELSGQAAEDAFWMSPSEPVAGLDKGKQVSKEPPSQEPGVTERGRSRSPTRSPSSSPPAHLYKRTRIGLLSPPKSHRRRSSRKTALTLPLTAEEGPLTPPTKLALAGVRKKLFPERDSPNNPFLVGSQGQSPVCQGSDSITGASSREPPRTPRKRIERPTLTYVFRGVRQEFQNPHYDPRYPETGVAPSDPSSPSNLPPEDPSFSPAEYCAPRLLFPEAKTGRRRRVGDSDDEDAVDTPKGKGRQSGKKVRLPVGKRERVRSEWDTSDEEESTRQSTLKAPVTPPRVAPSSRPAGRRQAATKVEDAVIEPIKTRAQTRAQTARAAPAIPDKDRSDPARRALGPRERGKPWR